MFVLDGWINVLATQSSREEVLLSSTHLLTHLLTGSFNQPPTNEAYSQGSGNRNDLDTGIALLK